MLSGPEEAATHALLALEFLAADAERFADLMNVTGLTAQDLRQGATEPAFLGGILDYMLANEPLLLEWARSANLPPEVAAQARRHLPGGNDAS